jgi:hypothetical protein
MAAVRSLFAPPIPPQRNAPPGQRIAWIRNLTREYTRDLVLAEHFRALKPEEGRREAWRACTGFAKLCGASREETERAATAEWDAATQAVERALEDVRRKALQLAGENAAEAMIQEAVGRVMFERGIWASDKLLAPMLRRIWFQAHRKKRRAA